MSYGSLHHVEMCVGDGPEIVRMLTDQYGFHLRATRETNAFSQWLLRCGKGQFLVTERKTNPEEGYCINPTQAAQTVGWSAFCCRDKPIHKIDSVFDVALEVKDVDSCVAQVIKYGGCLIRPQTKLAGGGIMATVASPVGNVVHTLIQHGGSNGTVFLPGFVGVKEPIESEQSCDVTHIDHVALVVREGESNSVLHWYEACFGMRRFLINRDESLEEGMVIANNVGMRLRAMEFWKCAEVGLMFGDHDQESSIKIVLAETLNGYTNSQIDDFLRHHEGPGVQHVALYTPNISKCVESMVTRGVKFHSPPPTYYTRVGKRDEMVDAGEDPEKLKSLGILMDDEADASGKPEEAQKRYLMQIFTRPIFSQDTFFLEVIQRIGATGFGAGNILALSQSIDEYRHQCEKRNPGNLISCKKTFY